MISVDGCYGSASTRYFYCIHRHDRYVVNIPPNNNPITNPITAIALKSPKARLHSGPSSHNVDISDKAAGARIAAPTLWDALDIIRRVDDVDNPPIIEDAAKIIRPKIKVFLLPK